MFGVTSDQGGDADSSHCFDDLQPGLASSRLVTLLDSTHIDWNGLSLPISCICLYALHLVVIYHGLNVM